jgi:polar amino acid transport system permease protein
VSTFDILWTYRAAFLSGLTVTLKLCAIVWSVGLSVGVVIGTLSARKPSTIGLAHRTMSFVLGGLPILVFLFWAHYPLQVLLGVVIDPFVTAAAVLSIVNIFAVSDAVRSVLADIPTQYTMAAKAYGLSPLSTLVHIQLPLTVRQLIPALLPIQIAMLHTSLFASLISVEETFRVAQRINSLIYRPVEIYTALGIFFLSVSLPMNALALWLRARFTRIVAES